MFRLCIIYAKITLALLDTPAELEEICRNMCHTLFQKTKNGGKSKIMTVSIIRPFTSVLGKIVTRGGGGVTIMVKSQSTGGRYLEFQAHFMTGDI